MASKSYDLILRFTTIVILAGMTIFFRIKIDRSSDEIVKFTLAPPPPNLKFYSFGFNESVADSLWLRYIQDLDKCKLHGVQSEGKAEVCSKGWAFLMLDQITDLAPQFRMPYAVGPISLSVLSDDYDGAGVIFEKALRAFPNDWKIQYKAAYYYLYDKKDQAKAAHLLLQAHKNGGPEWLPLLASKLYDKSGQLALGISTLSGYLKQISDVKIKERVQRRIARLECERDALARGLPTTGCGQMGSDY